MNDLYQVIFKGELLEGFDNDTVIAELATIWKMEKSKAEKLLLINKPTILKKGLQKEEAEEFVGFLAKAGLKVNMKVYEKTVQNKVSEQATPQPFQAQAEQPKKQNSNNPYAAPDADLGVKNQVSGDWLDAPKKLSASHGWKWISSAASLFFGAPFKWIAMGIIATLLSLLITLIPIIGSLIYYIPSMIFAGGAMIAAQEQMEGNELKIKLIFSGFSTNRNQLALLGVLYLAGTIALGIVMVILFFITLGPGFLPMFMGQEPDPAMFDSMNNILMFVVILLVGFGLSIPMLMAAWFSAPLVALGERSAVQAFRQSFQACLKNMLPFLIYGLAFLVIGIGFFMIFGIVGGVVGFFAGDGGSSMISAILIPVLMVVFGLPLMVISGLTAYTGFVDIFSTTTTR